MEDCSKLLNSIDTLMISMNIYDKFILSKTNIVSSMTHICEINGMKPSDEQNELIETSVDVSLKKQFMVGFTYALTLISEECYNKSKNTTDDNKISSYRSIIEYVDKVLSSIDE